MALTITELPAAPDKFNDSPYEFSQKANAWVAAMATFTTEANALAAEAESNAAAAESEADAAAVSAAEAAASAATALAAPGTSAFGTANLTLGTGSKSITIQTGKDLVAGMKVIIARSSYESTYWMYGTITSYDSGTGALVVSVEAFVGSGTYNVVWVVTLSGPALSPGMGQTWTSYTSPTRQKGVTYTNDTGRPIMVMISFENDAEFLIGGVVRAVTTASLENMISFIVPVGVTYRLNGSWTTITMWHELR